MNHPAQRYNNVSPIRTVITTITRKSVNILNLFFIVFGFSSSFSSAKKPKHSRKVPLVKKNLS